MNPQLINFSYGSESGLSFNPVAKIATSKNPGPLAALQTVLACSTLNCRFWSADQADPIGDDRL